MDLLTPKDFNQTPYRVPNAEAQTPSGGVEENTDFANYINEKVNEVLVKLLGSSLYESFLLGLEALPDEWLATKTYMTDEEVFYKNHVWQSWTDNNLNNVPGESVAWNMIPDSFWLDLYNGTKYGNSIWVGMKKMLVPYVYAMWLRDTYDDHTKNGVVRRAGENSTMIDPTKRISRAYNVFSSYAGNYYSQQNTLYGYLMYSNSLGYYYHGYSYDINHRYPYYYYDNPTYGPFENYLRHGCSFPGNMNIFNI